MHVTRYYTRTFSYNDKRPKMREKKESIRESRGCSSGRAYKSKRKALGSPQS